MRRAAIALALVLLYSLVLLASPEGSRVWFKFNKAFINANYDNGEAFGRVRAQTWGAAAKAHVTKCGGDDGELHVGALDGGLDVPAAQSPSSGKASGTDATWGAVFELPDAKGGIGPATLTANVDKTVTFDGYFRVWNEGHWKGNVASTKASGESPQAAQLSVRAWDQVTG